MSRHTPGEPACKELFERLSDYIDGELPPDLCAQIDEHMGGCSPCQEFIDSLRETVRLMQDTEAPPLPEEIRTSVSSAYQRYRRETDSG